MTTRTGEIHHGVLVGLSLGMAFLLAACFNSSNAVHSQFDSLEPGITSTQLARTLGSPDEVVGEITTIFGQRVAVWEYEKLTSIIPTEHAVYWVYLVDGRFQKYAMKGDWRKEKEILYRTDFSKPQEE